MSAGNLPRVRLIVGRTLPRGKNVYQAIPEMVEFRRLDEHSTDLHTLALGRLAIVLDGKSGELVGLQCYVKTGRWRRGDEEPPPEPDADGVLVLEHPRDVDGFAYLPAEPRFLWHEGSSALRISLGEETALVFKVADCLMAGVDRGGLLSDLWLLDLDLALD